MGCNAWNHPRNCNCGWGGDTGGGSGTPQSDATKFWLSRIESYTNPNAYCPVCGASVYFYQSPSGGRVFFDELGPPWPKHPCTDNGKQITLVTAAAISDIARQHPQWDFEGWMPIRMSYGSNLGASYWRYVNVYIIERKDHIVVLIPVQLNLPTNFVAAFDGFDRRGYGNISIMDLDAHSSVKTIEAYQIEKFKNVPVEKAVQERRIVDLNKGN